MIIDDIDERTPLKSPQTTSAPHELALESALPPSPPPYVSYQAIPPPSLAPSIVPRKKSRRRLGRPKARKYLIAGSIVLNCLFFLLWIRLIRGPSIREDSGKSRQRTENPEIPVSACRFSMYNLADLQKSLPIQAAVPDPRIGQCVQNVTWTNTTRLSTDDKFSFSSDASFGVPHPSPLLFLLSQGALSGGHLEVLPSSGSVPYVLVTARYHSSHVRDRANVCWMERKHGAGAGVGIFVSSFCRSNCHIYNLNI
jgi:hypothetical protein